MKDIHLQRRCQRLQPVMQQFKYFSALKIPSLLDQVKYVWVSAVLTAFPCRTLSPACQSKIKNYINSVQRQTSVSAPLHQQQPIPLRNGYLHSMAVNPTMTSDTRPQRYERSMFMECCSLIDTDPSTKSNIMSMKSSCLHDCVSKIAGQAALKASRPLSRTYRTWKHLYDAHAF